MDRAIAFYTAFFEQAPIRKDPIYSIFDIHSFRLGLFAYEKMHEEHTFGTNCLPSIQVESLSVLKKKLAGLKIVFPLTKIGDNWVSEFEDSEGNHLELTAPIEKQS
jgi:predicted enzyme related to lactoylglutathione lyase